MDIQFSIHIRSRISYYFSDKQDIQINQLFKADIRIFIEIDNVTNVKKRRRMNEMGCVSRTVKT